MILDFPVRVLPSGCMGASGCCGGVCGTVRYWCRGGLFGGGAGSHASEQTAQLAVAMREEPGPNYENYSAENYEFMADNQSGQNHEDQAAEGYGRAGGDAANDQLKRWPENRSQSEDEHYDANPDYAFEAGEFCADLAGGVFLGCAEFGARAGVFGHTEWNVGMLEHWNVARWRNDGILERWNVVTGGEAVGPGGFLLLGAWL